MPAKHQEGASPAGRHHIIPGKDIRPADNPAPPEADEEKTEEARGSRDKERLPESCRIPCGRCVNCRTGKKD